MSEQTDEAVREAIYDIVLAARTEGVIWGKTKRFADGDTDQIYYILKLREKAVAEEIKREIEALSNMSEPMKGKYNRGIWEDEWQDFWSKFGDT